MPDREDVETRELQCTLTESELLARGAALAEAELQIERLKLKRADVSAEIKAQRELRRELAGVIDTGTERRDVRCVWIEDFSKNCFRLIRQDTGEEVDTRAMTADDRQLAMDDVGGGEPGRPAEETIDLDDEAGDDDREDDEDNQDDLDDEGDDEGLGDEGDDTPEPEPEPVKTKSRGRQPQPVA